MRVHCKMCDKIFSKEFNKDDRFIPNICSPNCFILYLTQASLFQVNYNKIIPFEDKEKMPFFRSNYEYRMAQWLTKNKFTWLYEPAVFTLKSGKRYVPDFLLPSTSIFIEVKGKWLQDSRPKFLDFCAEYNYNIVLINNSFLSMLARKEKGKYNTHA